MEFLVTRLPKLHSKAIRIQLVQTLSMLIHNIQSDRTLYYILSNNYLNTLIMMPEMYKSDDVCSWTISLIKTLSGLLDKTTIKFFFQEKRNSFPLLDQSMKFLVCTDSMKRAHAMTVILNTIRVKDPGVIEYMMENRRILLNLSLYLLHCWRRLNLHVRTSEMSGVTQTEESLMTECDDALCFLQDIMDLGIEPINTVTTTTTNNTRRPSRP